MRQIARFQPVHFAESNDLSGFGRGGFDCFCALNGIQTVDFFRAEYGCVGYFAVNDAGIGQLSDMRRMAGFENQRGRRGGFRQAGADGLQSGDVMAQRF